MKRRFIIVLVLLLETMMHAQAPDHVRIAVAGLFHSNQFVVETLPSQPLIVHAGARDFTVGQSATGRVTVARNGQRLLLGINGANVSAQSVTFTGRTGEGEFTLSIPPRFRRRYRGTLTITASKTELISVVEMDVETAVASVVAAEGPADARIEFLKALAVASRSYLIAGAPRHRGVDFCDTTHCQFLRNPPVPNSPAALAARDTRGLVLTYSDKPFAAMYSASCGGRSHTLAELGLAQHDYPYYAVECPYCRRNPDKWSARVAEAEAASVSQGERERLDLARKLGWNVVPSNNFESRQTTDGVVLSGVGHGHGLGLCQRGAAAMAREGQDFRAILAHYYPNTVLDSIRH